ncbi:heterokaryon incompatibility protein-domain-containing protein, partial [Lasiosphaeria ovina]
MHLLHCAWDESSSPRTVSISLRACISHVPPPYAILSHRWAANPEDEVTFDDMMAGASAGANRAQAKPGYEKLRMTCTQALLDGLSWAWIDTCCIDKRSSAELSEAINSMFSWYEKSDRCYAYLEDVYSIPAPLEGTFESELRSSVWFSRGWTLQELIAPAEVEFFAHGWRCIGAKTNMAPRLSRMTGIAEKALVSGIDVYEASVAEKMSWAANRITTRPEDRAYSLMGLFGVNMPTLYGEGHSAFTRLQHEIMRLTSDHTIFTW